MYVQRCTVGYCRSFVQFIFMDVWNSMQQEADDLARLHIACLKTVKLLSLFSLQLPYETFFLIEMDTK